MTNIPATISAETREFLASKTVEAFEFLYDLMKDETASVSERIRAAEWLLEAAYGKSKVIDPDKVNARLRAANTILLAKQAKANKEARAREFLISNIANLAAEENGAGKSE